MGGVEILEQQVGDSFAVVNEYIRANQAAFYRLAYTYVHNQDIALDVVQDSIVNALTHLSSLRHPEYVKNWFYRILINECLSYHRKSKRIVLMDTMPEDSRDDWLGHGDRLDVCKALDALEPRLRTIVVLRFFEDMKLTDIAAVTHTNLNTVKSRLYKAMDKLRAELSD